ncbi:MAG: hypothetical protein V3V63_02595 [Candidatus Hydrothermarchaeaceae archaeon]|jgi:hypothetical protein
MPRKKQEVQTVRVPTTLPIGMVELIDSIIRETREFKSRSDFLEKGAFILIDKVIVQGDRSKILIEGKKQ